jgi:hypothetical protein
LAIARKKIINFMIHRAPKANTDETRENSPVGTCQQGSIRILIDTIHTALESM